jgi:autotransporter-associated beta strand protein
MKLKYILFAFATALTSAQAEISVGDIAIIRVNNNTDSFSYVSLVNISGTETILWRDSSWNSANGGWRTTETTNGSFTAPATAGTIGDISSGGGFNNGGEQVFLFQGDFNGSSTAASAKHKFGVNWDNSGWLTSGTVGTTSESYQPSTLVGNNGSIALGSGDQWYYSGMLTGTSKTLLSAIANPGNWTSTVSVIATTYNGVRSGAAFTINSSASFAWDNNGTTGGTGGTGTWDSTSANKWSNTENTTFLNNWVNSTAGNNHTAVFGGTAGTVTVSGGVTTSGLQFDTTGYTLTDSTITLLGGTTPSINTGSLVSATINSALEGSSGFNKTGVGALTLGSTSNSYTGATNINAGSLIVNGSTSASSAFTVASGATLGGSGTVGGSVNVSGNIAPNGILKTGTTTWNGGSNIFQFNLTESPLTSDKLDITGAFNKGTGSTFKFDFMGSAPTHSGVYTLATWTEASALESTFAPSNFSFENLTGTYDSGTFSITSNSLRFTAVPEASNLLIGGLLGLGLMSRRRKQA